MWLALMTGYVVHAATCPDLAGTFSCANQDGTSAQVELKVRQINGETRFWVSGTELVADDVPHPIPDDTDIRMAVARAGCEEGTPARLRFELTGRSYQDGIYVGKLRLVSMVSLVDGGLSYVTAGELLLGKEHVPLESTQLCHKLR